MPVPIILGVFADSILPEAPVQSFVDVLPISITNPYAALLYGAMLCYVPFSINFFLKVFAGETDNVDPRKVSEKLGATNPMFKRNLNAEKNLQEGYPYFAVAVLSCLQAGVARETVCMYATFWLVWRLAYCLLYTIQSNTPLSMIRTGLYSLSALAMGKLFALAIARSS